MFTATLKVTQNPIYEDLITFNGITVDNIATILIHVEPAERQVRLSAYNNKTETVINCILFHETYLTDLLLVLGKLEKIKVSVITLDT